jgi:hypothetical protein
MHYSDASRFVNEKKKIVLDQAGRSTREIKTDYSGRERLSDKDKYQIGASNIFP